MSGGEPKRFTVTGEWSGSRLDRFVRASLPGLSFPAAQTLLRKGAVLLNGKKAEGKERLVEGNVVEIRAQIRGPAEKHRPRDQGEEPSPRGRSASRGSAPGERAAGIFGEIGGRIPVLFEDEEMLAVDKPAGLPVQPGNRAELGSLVDLLRRYLPAARGPGDGPAPFAPSPVHRLDAATSGVLVAAKTRRAARRLSRAFSGGAVVKTYLAVVDGVPGRRSGVIDEPLRVEKGRASAAVPDPAGSRAVTRYRLLKELPGGRALLEVTIETGRTHQIRAHMRSIGHPVSGDPVYGQSRSGEGASPRLSPGRMLLHAWKISLQHPVTGDELEITAPPPPEFGL